MNTEEVLTHVSLGTEQVGHMVFVTSLDTSSGSVERRDPIAISPRDAFALAAKLIQSAEHALTYAVRDAAAGDCETCGNLRMIHPERHGRPSAERCPDCTDAWAKAEDRTPTLAVLAELEREVLR